MTKIKYNGPCKEVYVPGYGTFERGKWVDIDNAEALANTNVNFEVESTKITHKKSEVKKDDRR